MKQPIEQLPEEVEQEFLRAHEGEYFLWDYVHDLDGHIVLALALKTVTGMCVLEGFYFEHSEDASEEIFRLNRRLGLSDDEIVERIEFIVDREMPGVATRR